MSAGTGNGPDMALSAGLIAITLGGRWRSNGLNGGARREASDSSTKSCAARTHDTLASVVDRGWHSRIAAAKEEPSPYHWDRLDYLGGLDFP